MKHLIYIFAFLLTAPGASAQDNSGTSAKETAAAEETPVKKTGVFIPGEIVPGNVIIIRGRSESVIEQAGTGTTITEEQINAHSDKTLDEVLAAIPGLYIDTHTKGYTRLRMHGYEQDRILILMDGIPINDVFSTDFDIATIPAVNISKVVVSRGASSALYGASSAVGVINIISKSPKALYAQAKSEYGGYGNWTLNAASGAPVGDFYFWFTGSIINSDGFKPSDRLGKAERRKWFDKLIPYQLYGETFDSLTIPAKDQYINDTGLWDHSSYRKYDTAGKAGYNFTNGEAGVLARYNYKTGKTNTYEANCYSAYKPQNSPPWQDPVFQVSSPEDVKKAALRNRSFVWPEIYNYQAAPYLRYASGAFEFKTLAYFSFRKAIEQGYASADHEYIKDQAAVLSGSANDPYNDIKTYSTLGENTILSFKPRESHRIAFAVIWKDDKFLEQQQAISSAESPNIAATSYGTDPYKVQFLEAAYLSLGFEYQARFFDRLMLTAGISYDSQDFKQFKLRQYQFIYEDAYIVKDDAAIMGTRDAFNPAGGIIFDAVPRLLKLKGAASMKTRFPTLGEYAKIKEDNDRGLKPERISNISTGFELSFLSGDLVLESDYYYTMVNDRIKKIAGGDEPPVNIEKAVSQGAENSVKYTLPEAGWIKRAGLIFTYTYLRARYYDETIATKGEYADYIPSHQFTADIICEFISDTNLSLWGEHTAGTKAYVMESVPDPDAEFSASYFGTADLHDPYFLNIKISQQFAQHFSAYLLCKNLLDDYKSDPFNPGPGRMLYAGLTAEL